MTGTRRKLALAALFASALAYVPRQTLAAPTIWARARDPELGRRAALVEEADEYLLKIERDKSSFLDDGVGGEILDTRTVYLSEAARLLEEAGGEKSADPRIRFRLGYVLRTLGQPKNQPPDVARLSRAVPILRTVAESSAPDSLVMLAWSELAIAYAVLGRRDEEIQAYTRALTLEPVGRHRAVLLANRAESNMAAGDLEEAIRGYREALRSLLPIEMHGSGVTTLWGLAVALDRDGDLDGAFQSIALARAYDREDQWMVSSSWFFSPPYDDAWYYALGFWSTARTTTLGAVQAEAYNRAVEQWQSYLSRAPKDDRYVPLARVRLAMCEKERKRALERARHP